MAHRMWEALQAAHSQAAHAIGVLNGWEPCEACLAHCSDSGNDETGCDKWQQWQTKVTKGFGSL